MSGHLARFAIFVSAVLGARVAAAAAAPSTAPAASGAGAPGDACGPALADFRAGRFEQVLADAGDVRARRAVPAGTPADPDAINAAHLEAVADERLGRYPAAAQAMQRVRDANVSNRSIALNGVLIDVRGKRFAMRALKDAKAYATAHPDDEDAVDLWGAALEAAAGAHSRTFDAKREAEAFAKAEAALEATHPGMRHWGTRWVTPAERQEIEIRRTIEQSNVDRARAGLSDADARLAAAKDRVDVAAYLITHLTGHETVAQTLAIRGERLSELRAAEGDARAAQGDVDDAAAELKRAEEAVPKPSWTAALEPVEPELVR